MESFDQRVPADALTRSFLALQLQQQTDRMIKAINDLRAEICQIRSSL